MNKTANRLKITKLYTPYRLRAGKAEMSDSDFPSSEPVTMNNFKSLRMSTKKKTLFFFFFGEDAPKPFIKEQICNLRGSWLHFVTCRAPVSHTYKDAYPAVFKALWSYIKNTV